MKPTFHVRPPATVTAAAILAIVLSSCGGASATPSPAATVPLPSAVVTGSTAPTGGERPASPATLRIIKPADGAKVDGTSVHVVLDLQDAHIVDATTTDLKPDEGHIHLYVDNVLVSMNYGLEQDVEVHSGTYVLKAEFVAADHAPFSPRVWSPEVFFTVR